MTLLRSLVDDVVQHYKHPAPLALKTKSNHR